ncbi:hypothetical protein L7F22_066377 [Adiantum nelumboides]|nr:hypothetical protein [Adiantum nelumboides]
MSGGQKQRIAIARAMLKDPPVLLLDEATSALDVESETVVQAALNQAVLGRTTLVISHRLPTIRSAHMIAVLCEGKIVEMGQHEELLVKERGTYAALLQATARHNIPSDMEEKCKAVMQAHGNYMSTYHLSEELLPSEKKSAHASSPTHFFGRLVAFNKPEWWLAVKGSIGASTFGIIQPLYAFTLGSVISSFYLTSREEQQRSIRNYTVSFIILAIGSFLASLLQHYNFSMMGEIFTKRVRERMLAKVLRFEIGWFDRSENSSGAICSRLVSEASLLRALVSDCFSLIISTMVATVAAATLGMLISWRLASAILVLQPLAVVCYYTRRVLIRNISNQALGMQQESNHLAAEVVAHRRIIAAFSSQDTIFCLFTSLQGKSGGAAWRQAVVGGAGMGGSLLATHLILALSYWYGARLHSQAHLTLAAMFKTLFILFGTGRVIADAASTITSDIAKSASALASVFATLDRQPLIIPDDPLSHHLRPMAGDVTLCHVAFAYPSRPQVLVFSDLSLQVPAGHNLALVGPSGSGKSTVIGLILRFYDPLKGTVKIDGRDLRELHLRSMRQQIGLVSQEPSLISGSIRYNIAYGDEQASEEEIVQAAKAANAHDFICSLEHGYDTYVGERGTQLSGGQKQRIAIARAIVKRPMILLLDEATSALDMQSEKVVQEAMSRVMANRTTIVVAHRLSTIQTCNTICVLQNGVIVESGTHAQLFAKGHIGAYFKLVHSQQHSLYSTSTLISKTKSSPSPTILQSPVEL